MADNKVNKNVAPISSLTVPDPSKNQQKSGNICKSVAPLSSLTFPNSVVAAKSSNLSGLQPNNKSKLTTPQPPKTQLCSAPPGYESLAEVKVKTTSGLTPEMYANSTTVVADINRTFKTGDTTIIVETDKDVYINTIEDINEQKYITNACVTGSVMQVGTVTGSTYTNVACNISKLGFDSDSGFDVSDLGAGIAKIAMNSTFKFWEVNGNPGLTACGLDTVNFVAGCGVTITSCNTSIPKTLTISSTATGGVSSLNSLTGALTLSAGNNIAIGTAGNVLTICGSAAVGGCDTQVQYNNSGAFAGSPGLTYCSTTSTLGVSNISTTTGLNIAVGAPITGSWISLYGDLGVNVTDDYSSAVSYDSAGNIYSIGADGNTGVPFLVKYSPTGSIIWQVNFTEVNNYYKTGDAVEVDSSGNVYAIIGTDDAALEDFTLIKLNSSGTILWQKSFDIAAVQDSGVDIAVDSLSNVYVLAAINDTDVTFLAKLNSSGVVQWQRTLTVPVSSSAYPQGMAVDGSGNIYINTQNNEGGSYRPPVLVKYNTSGILQWQRAFGDGTSTYYSGLAATDSSGNVYTANNTSGNSVSWLIKWSSSGSIIWQKEISTRYPIGLSVDALNNIYIALNDGGATNSILKFDQSGTLLWQRDFICSGDLEAYYYWATQNLDVYNNFFAISGYTYLPNLTNAEAIVAQLPTDGTGVGVYGNYSYVSSTYTVTASTLVATTGTLIDAAGTVSVTNGPYTTATAAGTNTVIPVTGVNNFTFTDNLNLELPGYSLTGLPGNTGQLLTADGAGSTYWSTYSPPAAQPFIRGIVYGCVNNCNTALGVGTGVSQAGGNVSIGYYSNFQITTGCNNTAVGKNSMTSNITGGDNVVVGTYGLSNANSPCQSIAIGTRSLGYSSGSCLSIAIGSFAQAYNNGCCNIAIGNVSQAGSVFGSSNTGSNNVSIGIASLNSNTYGNCNIAIGSYAGGSITTGCNNTVIGNLPAINCTNTLLIGSGSCERIKVDGTGLYINGSLFSGATPATPTTIGSVFGYTTGCGNVSIGCCAGNTTQTGSNNIAIGCCALPLNTTGSNNIALGYLALQCNFTGGDNIAIGAGSLFANTAGRENVSIGSGALSTNVTGNFNVAVGRCSLNGFYAGNANNALGWGSLGRLTTGCNNIAIGFFSGYNIFNGCDNTIIGQLNGTGTMVCTLLIGAGACERIKVDNTGLYINGSLFTGASTATPTSLGTVFGYTTGISNVGIGCCAGNTTQTGCNNIAIGCCSLFCNTAGAHNFAAGFTALKSNTTGCANFAQGYQALFSNTTGSTNFAVGCRAMLSNTTGINNFAVGQCALASNTFGFGNIGIGNNVLRDNCVGCNNIAFGACALNLNTAGSRNFAAGCLALFCNSTGNGNIAIGATAMYGNTTGSSNISLGYGSLGSNTIGSNNIAIGHLSLRFTCTGSNNIAIGTCAGLMGLGSSSHNIAQGFEALCQSSGNFNIAIGSWALGRNGSGTRNIAIGLCSQEGANGADNISQGYLSMRCNIGGTNNIALGTRALFGNPGFPFITCFSNNIALGTSTLECNLTGGSNIGIGNCVLRCSTIGVGNIVMGLRAAENNITGFCNIAIGLCTLRCGTAAANNISIGNYAMECSTSPANSSNIAIGSFSMYLSACGGNVGIGNGTLYTNSGSSNIALGPNVLCSNTSGSGNIGVGLLSLVGNTSGFHNVGIGSNSLRNNSTGSYNIAIGEGTMYGGVGAAAYQYNCNIGIGNSALRNIWNGARNIGLGTCTLWNITCGNDNIAQGYLSQKCARTGLNNISIGSYSQELNQSGCNNISLGSCSLRNNIASNNIAIGDCAGCLITTGANNTVIGNLPAANGCVCTLLIAAGTCERIRVDNTGLYVNGSTFSIAAATPTSLGTVFGYTSSGNTFIGCCMGNATSAGNNNFGLGRCSMENLANGGGNIGVGETVLRNLTTGCNNIGIGGGNLYCLTTGCNNIAIGCGALYNNINAISNNTAIGFQAQGNARGGCNVVIGACALTGRAPAYGQSYGCANVALGAYAMFCTITASCNVAIGCGSLYSNTAGCGNVAVGHASLCANTVGVCNISIGLGSMVSNTTGASNISIGACAGCSITTGAGNTIIGSLPGSAGLTCTLLIGAGTCERLRIDNTCICVNGSTLYTLLTGNGLCNTAVGFRIVPQNIQCADYTIVAADSAGHVLHPAVDTNPRTFTIPSNATVAFPVGTSITIVNESFYPVTIAITSDTLYLAGSTTVGSRTLGQNGVATILKIQNTVWLISGSGLT